MELAKIRSKGRQEGIRQPDAEPEHQSSALPEPPPVFSLPDDVLLPDQQPVSFPGPAQIRHVAPHRRFDPLSLIVAGREHDRQCSLEPVPEADVEQPLSVSESEYEEFLCFKLGEEEYGINIMQIKEIIKPRELTEVPRMPSYLDGVLSLRGVIVPVYALRRRLAMPLDHDKSVERIVIVRCHENLYGVRVDKVTDVVRIGRDQREQTPSVLEGAAREFVSGIGRSGDRMVIMLDVCRVVDTCTGEGV